MRRRGAWRFSPAAPASIASGDGLVVFDTGGGSTQFTFGPTPSRGALQRRRRRGALHRALRPRRRGRPKHAAAQPWASIAVRCSRSRGTAPDAVIGIGGTVTNLAAVKHGLAAYDPDVVHGTSSTLPRSTGRSRCTGPALSDERRTIVGLQPSRAEVILSGACIVRTILTMLGNDSLTVSDRGLRHGVRVERYART